MSDVKSVRNGEIYTFEIVRHADEGVSASIFPRQFSLHFIFRFAMFDVKSTIASRESVFGPISSQTGFRCIGHSGRKIDGRKLSDRDDGTQRAKEKEQCAKANALKIEFRLCLSENWKTSTRQYGKVFHFECHVNLMLARRFDNRSLNVIYSRVVFVVRFEWILWPGKKTKW